MTHSLEAKIKSNLTKLLPQKNSGKKITLLLAVSGGADSIAMLSAAAELRQQLNFDIFVITVNHNIRPKKESAGDAAFVENFCKSLTPPPICIIAELAENAVSMLAEKRKGGIEDAARFLRYAEFEKAFKKVKADYILTAHNRNDYYETVLMRLFQGGDSESVSGIAEVRGKFIRPMLNISRAEIEDYLNSKGINWREDATNAELSYLRNKIRHTLIPALNTVFDGWQTGLSKTLEKLSYENSFIQSIYDREKNENLFWKLDDKTNSVSANFNSFFNLEYIFKLKFVEEGLLLIKGAGRIPYSIIKTLAEITHKKICIYSGGFCIEKIEERVVLSKKDQPPPDDLSISYMIWIEKECEFSLPFPNCKKIKAVKTGEGFFITSQSDGSDKIGPFNCPFCIRSKLQGDTIKQKDGSSKQIKKILNEWDTDYVKRSIVPIIEERGIVRGIYGAFIGKKNWYIPEVK